MIISHQEQVAPPNMFYSFMLVVQNARIYVVSIVQCTSASIRDLDPVDENRLSLQGQPSCRFMSGTPVCLCAK